MPLPPRRLLELSRQEPFRGTGPCGAGWSLRAGTTAPSPCGGPYTQVLWSSLQMESWSTTRSGPRAVGGGARSLLARRTQRGAGRWWLPAEWPQGPLSSPPLGNAMTIQGSRAGRSCPEQKGKVSSTPKIHPASISTHSCSRSTCAHPWACACYKGSSLPSQGCSPNLSPSFPLGHRV